MLDTISVWGNHWSIQTRWGEGPGSALYFSTNSYKHLTCMGDRDAAVSTVDVQPQ